MTPHVRRARSIHAHWRDGDLVLENYVTRVAVSAAPITIQILSFFEEWRPRSELADELDRYSPESIGDAVQQLIDRTLLVEEGTEVATSDEAVARAWQYWMPHGAFHFATKDAAFVPQEEWPALAADFLSAADQPSLTKRYPDRPAHPLPPATEEQDAFLRVLLARKTHREYSGASVPLTSPDAPALHVGDDRDRGFTEFRPSSPEDEPIGGCAPPR